MEPCAPGTEDEPPIMFSTLNKQENEQERLLKQKAILRNGRYENVFELSYVNGSEHWFCKVCECPVMGRVFQHEVGRRHTQNLSNTNRHIERQTKEEPLVEEEEVISVAPGEPVPPGFEDELSRVAQIQERLDGFKAGPLVALEYLLELQDYDPTKEPLYLCILCDKRGDPRTVLTHLASYNHITQYLQKHFPSCYRSLAPYMTKQYKRNWQVTLQKIAEGIEKKFGRLSPFPIDKDKFEMDRVHYLTLIGKGKHFSEQSGHTFEELVVHDELTKTHEDERSYENSSSNNWGGSNTAQNSVKKRSPSPPVVAVPLVKKMRDNEKSIPQSTHETSESTTQKPPPTRKRSLSSVSSVSSNDLEEINSSRREQGGNKYRRSPVRGRQLPYSRRNKSPTKKRYSPVGRRRSPGSRRQSPFNRRSSPFSRRSSPSGRRSSPVGRRSPGSRRFSPSSRRQSPGRRGRSPGYQRRSRGEEKKISESEKMQKIEEFKKLCKAIENDLQNVMKQHEKNPERHPQYNDEWKKFWNRRYKELQDQGVDTAKYDFKPEWIQFWNRRMTELHNDELKSRKEALRRRLGLDEITPIKFKIGHTSESSHSHQGTKPHLPMAAQPDQDTEVIIIDDKDDEKSVHRSHSPWEKDPSPRPRSTRRRSKEKTPLKERSSRTRRRSRSKEITPPSKASKEYSPRRDEKRVSRTKDISPSRDEVRKRDLDLREMRSRSREKNRESKRPEYRESSFERDMRGRERIRTIADLPWERDKVFRNMYEDYYKPPTLMRDVTRLPMESISPEIEENDGEINVVDVLRILTALEDRLGSLGPRVIDLLAQALAMEKKEANSSDHLLDNDVNSVLFETIKEKLKGQLLTGLVDIIQERAVKKAIKKIASLIHMAGQRKKQRDKTTSKTNAVTVPGVGNVDRAAIAKQIANALIMQGKTDVTQAELEQLINAVVGMAEASKNADKPMTTANFLQQFSNSPTQAQTSLSNVARIAARKAELSDLGRLTEPLTPSPEKNSTKEMENLSDSDLQTLLQNFKDLSTDEQHNLISYLKKLEYQEPERVEKLRQFVNLEAGSKLKDEITLDSKDNNSRKERHSPFSSRSGGINPTSDLVNIESDDDDDFLEERDTKVKEEKEKVTVQQKIHLDSDEEDYTFDDVVKTATKTVKDKELESNMKIVKESMKFDSAKSKEQDLSSAKDLISNLMSNINKHNTPSKGGVDLLGLGGGNTAAPPNMLTSTADFAKTFNNINIDSLANIVSTVKNLSSTDTQLKYEPASQNLGFEPPSTSNRQPDVPGFHRFERPKDTEESFLGPPGNSANFYNRAPVRDFPRGGAPFQPPNRFQAPRNRNPTFYEENYPNNPMPQQNMRGPRPAMNQWNNQRFGGYNEFNRPSGYNRWL